MIMLHACARLTSRAYDMNGAGVRCFRTVMISPAYLGGCAIAQVAGL